MLVTASVLTSHAQEMHPTIPAATVIPDTLAAQSLVTASGSAHALNVPWDTKVD
jgi:hypothetical protein